MLKTVQITIDRGAFTPCLLLQENSSSEKKRSFFCFRSPSMCGGVVAQMVCVAFPNRSRYPPTFPPYCIMKVIHPTSHRKRFSIHDLLRVERLCWCTHIYVRTWKVSHWNLEPSPRGSKLPFGTIRYPPTHPIIRNWKFSFAHGHSIITPIQSYHIPPLHCTGTTLHCTRLKRNMTIKIKYS